MASLHHSSCSTQLLQLLLSLVLVGIIRSSNAAETEMLSKQTFFERCRTADPGLSHITFYPMLGIQRRNVKSLYEHSCRRVGRIDQIAVHPERSRYSFSSERDDNCPRNSPAQSQKRRLMDSNKWWRFVIHGCIDGYSRAITFLRCSTNNKAKTVLDGFKMAVAEFGLPEMVRSDMGLENVDVCTYMLQKRGPNVGCFRTGKSVHNQRIERLWRDVFTCCTSKYYNAFYEMEDEGILNQVSEVDMFCLHYIFLPVINHNLALFRESWMNHRIRTEHNLTPEQLWRRGVLGGYHVDWVLEDQEDHGNGIEGNNNHVVVPPVHVQLTEDDLNDLSNHFPIDASRFSDIDEVIMIYREVRKFVNQKLAR